MKLDQSLHPTRHIAPPFEGRQNLDSSFRSGYAADMRDLVTLVVSSKRIETHRNEDKKRASSGSKPGKSSAPFDTSARRLIEGEDEKAYRRLMARLVAEAMPKTVLESMLVDQMVGDLWRLRRVEQAERAFFEQIRVSAIARVLRTLSAQELELLPELVQGETLPAIEGVEAISSTVRQKLQAAMDPDKLILDGVVSPDSVFPYSGLENIRRSLVRDLMHKSAYLSKQQNRPNRSNKAPRARSEALVKRPRCKRL